MANVLNCWLRFDQFYFLESKYLFIPRNQKLKLDFLRLNIILLNIIQILNKFCENKIWLLIFANRTNSFIYLYTSAGDKAARGLDLVLERKNFFLKSLKKGSFLGKTISYIALKEF